jgi:hypothetical protein
MTARQIESATRGERDIVRDPKKKRKKRDTFPAAEKFADDMFSLFIRARDKRCVTCGSTDRLQCSHVERRVRKATRYSEMNAFAQCARCHSFHHYQSETPLRDYQINKCGVSAVQMLYSLSRKECKRTAGELHDIGIFFRDRNMGVEAKK